MKAAILRKIDDLIIGTLEKPLPDPGEILLQVKAAAICGTDIKVLHHGHKHIVFPRVTGHEVSGVITALGKEVKGYAVGERVAVAPAIPCGGCYYCQRGWQAMCDNLKAMGYHYDGGFAEFMLVPESAVRNGCVNRVPDTVSFEEAAIAEPLACVINGQLNSQVGIGDTVVILGAGPIGCFHAVLAPWLGARQVILADISPQRLKSAEFTGARLVDMSRDDVKETVKQATAGRMAERVIVAAGVHQAQELAVELVAKRGSVNFFGGLPKERPTIQFNSNLVHYGEFFVVGTHGSAPHHNRLALDFIAAGKAPARRFITHTFPLDRIAEGLTLAENREGLKIVIVP